MREEDAKVVTDGMVDIGKIAIASSIDILKSGFEGFRDLRIPVTCQDGSCIGMITPYEEDKSIRYLVDFMIVYLDEASKKIYDTKQGEKHE